MEAFAPEEEEEEEEEKRRSRLNTPIRTVPAWECMVYVWNGLVPLQRIFKGREPYVSRPG